MSGELIALWIIIALLGLVVWLLFGIYQVLREHDGLLQSIFVALGSRDR